MVSVNKGISGATVNGNTDIEQLWYTWSDLGIDTIRAGYRIRAASAGLSDPNSAHVRDLNRYQRYTLPSGADPTRPPQFAPVSLALIDTGTERILVHKVYTGRDGVGRYGTFFVHLLADLPAAFTALDAISLWRSTFWRTFDDMGQSERSSTQLPTLSLNVLRQQEPDNRLTGRQFDPQIKKFLPYVIEAYLTKNLLLEKAGATRQGKHQAQPKLYIAAQDDLLAAMISGLLHTLPPQITQDLTFSTYENDIHEASTEIVGIGWPSDPAQAQNPAVQQLLPADYFQDKLAINCYTGAYTELKKNPQIELHPLASRFAQDATSHFLSNSPSRTKFAKFLGLAEKSPTLTISDALDLYKRIVLRSQKVTREDVEKALSPHNPVEYEISAEDLSDPDYQEKLIELVLTVPGWWQKYRPNVLNLYNHQGEYPNLREALATLSTTQAYPLVVNMTRQEVARLEQDPQREGGNPAIEARLRLLVDVMACMTPPKTDSHVWRSLLQDLRLMQSLPLFISPFWNVYTEEMKIWASSVPSSKEGRDLIAPFLEIPWERFADFLALPLPPDWTIFATNHLAYKSSDPLTPEIISGLGQPRPHEQIHKLLKDMAQNDQQWQTANGLFNALAQNGYRAKIELFFLLLDSPMGKDEKQVKTLLTYARLTLPEQALFLAQYGPRYLPDTKMKMTNRIMEMFTELAQSDYQQEKMQVLFAWLASPGLGAWFAEVSTSLQISLKKTTNFTRVLQAAQLNPWQGGDVLLQFGSIYIPRYPESQILLDLFGNYARLGTPERVTIVSMWLDHILEQNSPKQMLERILERVLDTALLSIEEKRGVLLKYGERYIERYPRSAVLSNYTQEFLQYLQGAKITLFKRGIPEGAPSAEERLLGSLTSLPESSSSNLVTHWYIVAQFVRNLSLLEAHQDSITSAIDKLASGVVQEPTRSDLLQELALACLPDTKNTLDEQSMVEMVLNVSSALQGSFKEEKNRERFLLGIAAVTRDVQKKESLLEPCVLIALRTKTLFSDKTGQALWIKTYLDTLFPYDDKKAFRKLSKAATRWPRSFRDDWERYLAQRQASTRVVPSPFKRPRQSVGYVSTLLKQMMTNTWTSARKHKIAILVTAVALLVVTMLLIYGAQASAQVTLTVAAQSYSQPMTLTAHTNGLAGTLPAQEIIHDFQKTGTGHATGTTRVGTAKAKTSICISNTGNAAVEIPTNSIVATADDIQFTTTAAGTYPAHTNCADTNNLIQIPVQAVDPGEHENVAASTITIIPDDSLAAIAKDNHTDAKSLHLTVTNFNPATGGKAKTASAITEKDLNTAKADLSSQLQGEIKNWVKDLSKDGVVRDPTTKVILINTAREDTAIDNGDTFATEVDVQATVLLVRNADLQKVALSQIRSALSKDKKLASYTVAENVKVPVAITQIKMLSMDDKSMKLGFSASTIIIPSISKQDIQNEIIDRSPATAKEVIMDTIPAVKKADIQIRPGFFPWLIPPWPNRINVTFLPDVKVGDLQDSAHS